MNRWIGSVVVGGLLLAGCAAVEPVPVTMYGGDPSSPDAAAAPFTPPPALGAGEEMPNGGEPEPMGEHPHGHGGTAHANHTGMEPAAAAVHARPRHPEVASPPEGECPKCGMDLASREVEP